MTAKMNSGCEPLTPDDIAEVVVFNASRRENVVIADTLIFPSHQVGRLNSSRNFDQFLICLYQQIPTCELASRKDVADKRRRLLQLLCIENPNGIPADSLKGRYRWSNVQEVLVGITCLKAVNLDKSLIGGDIIRITLEGKKEKEKYR